MRFTVAYLPVLVAVAAMTSANAQFPGNPSPAAEVPRDPLWSTLSDTFTKSGILLAADEAKALQKIIEIGSQGDTDRACGLLDNLRFFSSRRGPSAFSLVPRGEDSFDSAALLQNRQLVSAWMSFINVQSESAALTAYRMIYKERRPGTKRLYQSLAGLRYLNTELVTDSAIRQAKRAELTELVWFEPFAELRRRADLIMRAINSSHDADVKIVEVPLYDELKQIHEAPVGQIINHVPEGSAIVEIVEYDKYVSKNGMLQATPNYDAFVLRRGRSPSVLSHISPANPSFYGSSGLPSVARIELGTCRDVDALIAQWRRDIAQDSVSSAADQLARLCLWPILEHLRDVKRIYVVADGQFHSCPWAALPLSDGRLVVEQYGIAELPFSEYLIQGTLEGPIDRVASLRSGSTPPVLAVSGVAADLQHATEVGDFLSKVLPAETLTLLSGQSATVDAVCEALPRASIADLATHGLFAASALRQARQDRIFSQSTPQHSLLFAGLQLAPSANDAEFPTSILSAFSVSELNLAQLDLAVLAACETDVGEEALGEGGFALTRAFHLAGCRDVVASLWRVDDQATSDMMVDFYKELAKGECPIEALRLAQLSAMRKPLGATKQTRERGPLRPGATRDARVLSDGSQDGLQSTPVRLWAAFQLSGPGNRPVPLNFN